MIGKIVELDVREDLKNKLEPFQKIMGTVKTLEKGDIFVLHSTIEPSPLLTMMKLKGFANEVEKKTDNHYVTTFRNKKTDLSARRKDEELPVRPSCPAQDSLN